jgi:DnaJ-class molecular chaperone
MNDPYKTLGVAKTASEAEIKKAFRTAAKKYHPDTHPGDDKAKQKFQEISSAYDVIGDKDKRAKFDSGEIDASGNPRGFDPRAYGAGARAGNPFGGGGAGGNEREFHFSWGQGGEDGAGAGGFSAEDIFSEILGGRRSGGMGGGGRRSQVAKGEHFQIAVTVSFAEAIQGGTRRVILQNGEQIDVRVPAGLKDGQQIRVKGRGGVGRNGGPNGDVLIRAEIAPHPFIQRDGNDLRMDLPVTLREAVLGAKVPVPTLSGTLNLSIPPHSNSGAVLRLKGKGVPAAGGQQAGDLYVKLVIFLPDKPDDALTSFASGWNTAYDPRAKLR